MSLGKKPCLPQAPRRARLHRRRVIRNHAWGATWVRAKLSIFCLYQQTTHSSPFFFFFLAFALLCLFNKSALGCARCVSALGLLWSPLVQTAHRVRNRVCVVRLSTEQSMSLVLCLRCSGSLYLCTCTSTLPSPVPPEAYVCALTAAASKL